MQCGRQLFLRAAGGAAGRRRCWAGRAVPPPCLQRPPLPPRRRCPSARPGPAAAPPLSASMRRRRPAAWPGHGYQRPLHQLQEGRREPRAVSRAGPGRGAGLSHPPLSFNCPGHRGERGRACRGGLASPGRVYLKLVPASQGGCLSLGAPHGGRSAEVRKGQLILAHKCSLFAPRGAGCALGLCRGA